MSKTLLLVAFVPCIAFANISVSGTINTDTIWSSENGIYILENTVTVAASTTLTIAPGTIIKGKNGGAGILVIQGTLTTQPGSFPIIFTSYLDDIFGGDTNVDATTTQPTAQDWKGIVFEQGSMGNINNVVIAHAGYGVSGFSCGVKNSGGIVIISDSRIINNGNSGICNTSGYLSVDHSLLESNLVGITILAGTTTASSNLIKNNSIEGVHSTSPDPVILIDNTFTNNGKTAFIDAAAEFTHSGNTSTDISKRGFALAGFPKNGSIWHTSDLPIIISKAILWVQPGHTLTIAPGAIVKIDADTNLLVFGSLIAHGVPGAEIYFTSYRDDSIAGDTNGDGSMTVPGGGNWQNLSFQAGSVGQLSNVVMAYGGQANGGSAIIFNNGGLLSLTDVNLASSSQSGIHQNSGTTTATNVQLVILGYKPLSEIPS